MESNSIEREAINNKWFMDIQKIFDELDAMLSADEKERYIGMSKSDFTLTQHLGLGRWIRNNYIYSADSVELGDYFNYRIIHPDNISRKILEDYYDYLLKKEK